MTAKAPHLFTVRTGQPQTLKWIQYR